MLKRSLANLAKRNLAQLTALVKTGSGGCSTGVRFSKASSPARAWTSHLFCNLAIAILKIGLRHPIVLALPWPGQ
jgi:hypothetical protein